MVVGCAEAAVDVVVDRADVLHESVHARRADEALALRRQLSGEYFCLRSRRRYVGERARWALAVDRVGLRQIGELRGTGHHCACVVASRFDLGAVADDRRVLDQPAYVPRSHSCDPGDVEAVKQLLKRVPFPEHDLPAEPGLEHAKGQSFEQSGFVVRASAPNVVVVSDERRIAGAGPSAPRLSVRSDDALAHPGRRSFISLPRRATVHPAFEEIDLLGRPRRVARPRTVQTAARIASAFALTSSKDQRSKKSSIATRSRSRKSDLMW